MLWYSLVGPMAVFHTGTQRGTSHNGPQVQPVRASWSKISSHRIIYMLRCYRTHWETGLCAAKNNMEKKISRKMCRKFRMRPWFHIVRKSSLKRWRLCLLVTCLLRILMELVCLNHMLWLRDRKNIEEWSQRTVLELQWWVFVGSVEPQTFLFFLQ